jgi:hypothetical protein
MIIIGISLLVCLVGLLMYCLSPHAKVQAIGKDMFWVGLLAFLLTLPGLPGHTFGITRP